ncbi:MAG: hypothetical protein E7A06_12325 [Clostridiales bacterium]|nr:hypothetical protein [Clostridiales bacterium]
METITNHLDDAIAEILDTAITPPIAGAYTVNEIFTMLEERDYARNDEVLAELLNRLDTDERVREILTHAMRPALEALAHSHRQRFGAPLTDAFVLAVGCFYEALEVPSIRTKTQRIAARLRGEVLRRMNRAASADFNSDVTIGDNDFIFDEASEHTTAATTAHESQMELLEGLAWARDEGVITLDEARFLIAVYSPDAGIDLDTDLGMSDLSSSAIRKRASRLAQRIARAVVESTSAPLNA